MLEREREGSDVDIGKGRRDGGSAGLWGLYRTGILDASGLSKDVKYQQLVSFAVLASLWSCRKQHGICQLATGIGKCKVGYGAGGKLKTSKGLKQDAWPSV